MFETYYDLKASNLTVLREVRRHMRPEVRSPEHRILRHAIYREVLKNRAEMRRLFWN